MFWCSDVWWTIPGEGLRTTDLLMKWAWMIGSVEDILVVSQRISVKAVMAAALRLVNKNTNCSVINSNMCQFCYREKFGAISFWLTHKLLHKLIIEDIRCWSSTGIDVLLAFLNIVRKMFNLVFFPFYYSA